MTDGFSDKLGAVLGNPALMEQIKALANEMKAEGAGSPAPAEAKTVSTASPAPVLPRFRETEKTAESKTAHSKALLLALKPYLDAERREKADKLITMLGVAEAISRLL